MEPRARAVSQGAEVGISKRRTAATSATREPPARQAEVITRTFRLFAHRSTKTPAKTPKVRRPRNAAISETFTAFVAEAGFFTRSKTIHNPKPSRSRTW